MYGDAVDWKCSSQFSTDVADTAKQRLRERCLGANDVFYAVHRTDLLRGHFEAVRDCNPRDLFLMEQLVMFLTAIAGKTRQLDTLYIARQQDSPGSSGGAHQESLRRLVRPHAAADVVRGLHAVRRLCDRRRCHAPTASPPTRPADRRRVLQDVGGAVAARRPGRGADVSWSMPLVLQVVRGLVNLPRTSVLRRVALACYRHTRWLSHDFVHGTEFRTRRAREAAREFTPVRAFLTGRRPHDS